MAKTEHTPLLRIDSAASGSRATPARAARAGASYGDPPHHDGEFCHAGCTMNCDDLAIVEYWHRETGRDRSRARHGALPRRARDAQTGDWQRNSELEGDLPAEEGTYG